MRVLITGGAGVLGSLLVGQLLARDEVSLAPGLASAGVQLLLLDQGFAAPGPADERVERLSGDITDAAFVERAFSRHIDAVFHLSAVVSAGAEADFDLGMRVNIDGLRNVLEACRTQAVPPRIIFASSVAAFGGELPQIVTDATAATPQSSYGTQKVIGELLLSDMTRKGFIDARTLRLPTIVVRPGKPNRAASGFMSSILREPLRGEDAVCPVPAETRMWILSPERAVDALMHAMVLPAPVWGWNRTLNAPGITVSVAEALAALGRVAGRDAVARVRFERDPAIERIVLGWPARFETARAHALGFHADQSIDDIIHAHLRTRGR